MGMKVAIVGSRDYHDYEKVKKEVDNFIREFDLTIDYIISGGCTGVDKLAERYAKENNLKILIFDADWKTYGLKAGPMRNSLIVNECTHLIAFPSKDSKGTFDTINKAKRENKIVKIFFI